MGTIAVGQITITDLMDGAPGQNGIAASLTSDTHVVPTDVNGNNGFYTGCSSTIELYEGGKKLSTGVTYSFAPASGITGSGNTSTGTYTVTTMSVDASYVDLKATYEGSTYVKRFTITKAKQGSTGSQGIPGTPGSNGQSLYTWVKYADDALGNGMSDNPNGKKYIGLAYNKTTATESTNKADYEWTLVSNQTMLNNYSISGDISYGWQNAAGFSLVASDEIGYYGNLRTSVNEMQISEMMEIEPSRSYKISLTIKNPETDATNRGSWYFGIFAYDKNKNSIGTYVNKEVTLNDNPYFDSRSKVSAPFDWTTYEGYVHAYNIDTAKTIPKGNCGNYLRFDKKCKYIRVRFLNYRSPTSNYGDGKLGSFYYAHPTITAVDSSALTNNSEDVFNALTNNGAIQGIYMKDGQLYVNGQYINAKNLSVTNSGGVKTFYIDQSGNVSINANSLSIVAGGSGNIPTKNEVTDSIDAIEIGTVNRAFRTGESCSFNIINGTNQTRYIYKISSDLSYKKSIVTFVLKYSNVIKNASANASVQFNYYTSETDQTWNNGTNITSKITGAAGEVEISYSTTFLNIYENDKAQTFGFRFDNMSGDFEISKLKVETGTKKSSWTAAPEDTQNDIDNKVNIGGTINDINQSPSGQISYPKLNIAGAISFDDLASEMSQNFIAKKDAQGNRIQTVINGRTIETGTVTADKLNAYELNITKRRLENGKWIDTTIPTFNISQEGLIQASGTFKSFDFTGDANNLSSSENGWIITDTGESVFNNSIIRGRVELPNAGITDHGGYSNSENLLTDTYDFKKNWWLAVGGVEEGLDGNMAIVNKRSNFAAGQPRQQVTQNYNADIAKGTNVAISGYYYIDSSIPLSDPSPSNNNVCVRLYDKATSGITDICSVNFDKTKQNQWVYFSATGKTNFAITKTLSFVFSIGQNGYVKLSQVKMEINDKPTRWSASPKDNLNLTRFWAGASYVNREKAPFRVLQDGTIIASRGEFGGTFTGKIEIGNIVIEDTTTSYGTIKINNNDNSKTIVQISDDKSFFNSQLNLGTEDAPHFRYMPNTKALEALEGSSIIFNTKGSKKMRIDNGQYGAEVLMGDIISVYGEGDRLNVNSAAGGKFTVSIGNFADASTADDVFVDIDGSARVRNMTIAGGKFYESVDGTGIDLFIE